MRAFAQTLITAALLSAPVGGSHAQPPADFFKGRTVDLYIGYSVGGGYDVYARMVARHMGRHIPGNPAIVPKNMEGAGSIRLANWLYNVAPRDGTAFGTVSRGAAFDPLLGAPAAQFNAREFTWIGSANNEVSVCVAWHTTGIARFEDLLSKELVVGGSSTASDTDQFAKLLNALFGQNCASPPAIRAATRSISPSSAERWVDVAAGPGQAWWRRTSAGSSRTGSPY
jgi:tripartite-type tricarboxylate transporter receptor subunit TctC